jgi:hypothetical protein
MIRLASILYPIVATTLSGIGVIAVLSVGLATVQPIIVSALIGAVVALPISYLVARKIMQLTAT